VTNWSGVPMIPRCHRTEVMRDTAYPSNGVTSAIRPGRSGVSGGVILRVPGRGYAGSCNWTSENYYSTHYSE